MIHLISTFAIGQLAWLPEFIRHYRNIGVERFWLTPHIETSRPDTPENRQALNLPVNEPGITLLPPIMGEYTSWLLYRHHKAVQERYIAPHEWIVRADIDEFHVYPTELNTLLENLEARGVNAISGELIDRIARNGTLKPFRSDAPIWTQYPVGTNLTALVLRGFTHKVTAAKAAIKVGLGNHEIMWRLSPPVRWAAEITAIHHFKWDQTVLSRLAPRLRESWKRQCPWWVETQRFVDFMARRSRIDPEQLTAFDFGDGFHDATDARSWNFVRLLRENNQNWRSRGGFLSPVTGTTTEAANEGNGSFCLEGQQRKRDRCRF